MINDLGTAVSREVHEEGVLFDNWLLVENGRFREVETRRLLTEAPYPSRNPDTNLADLRAQIAANAKGDDEVRKMIDHFGLDVVQSYMRHVQDNAEEAVRRVIDTLTDGEYRYEMDSGASIAVKITVDREARAATIDFTGTSPQLGTNFNAPSSVATAAVLYVFRTLVADDIPLNDGCLRPLQLIIPDGCMLAPVYPAAVVAGNVETSQAITGALFGHFCCFCGSVRGRCAGCGAAPPRSRAPAASLRGGAARPPGPASLCGPFGQLLAGRPGACPI